ncbi:hypothetical protein LOD99_6114 [Oopsacas minuta]|uniref:Endonuclease III homolog n=1 Tax=Oopsacas minuta TaxID=111878 RepID=A0AAV7JNA3_9METZ|nr:hypothetical protein LOD99_6114 [Oopsacas minuta]
MLIRVIEFMSMASKRKNKDLTSDQEMEGPTKKLKNHQNMESNCHTNSPLDGDIFNATNETVTIKKSEYFDVEEILDKSKDIKNKSKKEPKPIIAPENWKEQYDNIRKMRIERSAPVDSMGVQSNLSDKISPSESRFHVLISLVLSSQTRDTINSAVMDKLRVYGLTIEHIRETSLKKMKELIHPVSFYNTKAIHIKKIVEILHEKYADDVPCDYDNIVALPGVGPKMALLMMDVAWNKIVGISVDTHVHRISNRLKWTGSKPTKQPSQTRSSLEGWLPREYWGEINGLLVGFGQQICKSITPQCKNCLNRKICPSSNNKK